MKRINILCTFLLLLAVGSQAESAKSHRIVATLALPYETVLPGVPFDIYVTLRNVSDTSASVGMQASLIVTLPDGSRFAPKDEYRLQPSGPSIHPDPWVELAPGETRQMVVSWEYDSLPNWTRHQVFSGPGSYDIALELGLWEPDAPRNYVGTLVTNTAKLHRKQLQGEDEDLWKRMNALSEGGWSDNGFTRLKEGMALAQQIINLHPTSEYYPYALILRSRYDLPDEIERARDAAARFSGSPAHSYLLMHAAKCALNKATLATEVNHDRATGEKYFALARVYLDDALKSTSNPALLDSANRSAQIIRHNFERADK
jgi:hypothetical protein